MKIKYNTERLNKLVNEKYDSHHDFATALGMSDRELEFKLGNPGEFTVSEAEKACGLLGRKKTALSYLFFDYTIIGNGTEEKLSPAAV